MSSWGSTFKDKIKDVESHLDFIVVTFIVRIVISELRICSFSLTQALVR